MAQTQLFPPEIIESTTETYLPEVMVRSQVIYTAVLLALTGVLIALPFIKEDVSVQSAGVLISPDSNLVVKSYLTPQDIRLIKKGMKVNFQIDAFNYNEWGLVSGKVIDIAQDFVLLENRTFFKVKSQLDKQTLQLKNGYTAQLKKGLSLQSRFVVTKRSLFQLLYDTADDWLNPAGAS